MLQFTFSWIGILTLVVSVVLPVLVALVTTRITSPGKKAVTLAFLSALTGFGAELLNALTNNTAYDVFTGLLTFVTAFIIGVALHFGLWKPTGVASTVQGSTGIIK
jgi:hypothetical protein